MTAAGAAATVVAVAGRRIDAPDAAVARFPLRNRQRVREAIASVLAAGPVLAVVSSAACGADLLALDAAHALGIRRRVILPFAADRFRRTSVVDRPGDWGPLFDALIADAEACQDLVVLGAEGDDEAFMKTNSAILNEGHALAVSSGSLRRALAVWDGASRGPEDLTGHFKAEALSRGWAVQDISTR